MKNFPHIIKSILPIAAVSIFFACKKDLQHPLMDADYTMKGTANSVEVGHLINSNMNTNYSLAVLSPATQPIVKISFFNITANTFGISADLIAPLSSSSTSNWKVAEVNANMKEIPATLLANPSAWKIADPNSFNGYVGTGTLGDSLKTGVFQFTKRYRIVYNCKCDFATANSFAAIIDPVGSGGNSQKIRVITDPAQTVQ